MLKEKEKKKRRKGEESKSLYNIFFIIRLA
jgi:hypothetical protein